MRRVRRRPSSPLPNRRIQKRSLTIAAGGPPKRSSSAVNARPVAAKAEAKRQHAHNRETWTLSERAGGVANISHRFVDRAKPPCVATLVLHRIGRPEVEAHLAPRLLSAHPSGDVCLALSLGV